MLAIGIPVGCRTMLRILQAAKTAPIYDTTYRLSMSTYFPEEIADEWISQAEAARIRGVSRQAIARLVKRGRLRVLKIGGRVLVLRRDVEKFIPETPGRRSK